MRGSTRWVRTAGMSVLALAIGLGGMGSAGATSKPAPPAFTTGSWKISFDATVEQHAAFVDSVIDVHGEGTANVENGQLTATCTATGSTYGTVTTAGHTYDVSGALTVSDCAFHGPANAPVWSATTGFAGTVNGAGAGGTFGPISSPLTIQTASHDRVEGDWQDQLRANTEALGVDVTGPAAFVAEREGECPSSGPVLPTNRNGRIQNGTPAAPTVVHIDVDPSVSGVPTLDQGLEAAIVTWNSELEAAGRNVEFTTESGPGPTVHVAVDSPSVEQTLGAPPLGSNSAAETDVVHSTPGPHGVDYTQVANTVLRSGGLSPAEPWDAVSPDLVEHLFLHELGHVLGLGDNTTTPDSIMWSKLKTSERTTSISCADQRTLQSL